VQFVLPQNVTPILDAGGFSLLPGDTGLKNLNTNPAGSISGSFDPVTRTVHFILISLDGTSDLGTGDIARLTYQTTSGAELSPQDIHPVFKVPAIVNGTSSDISSEIVPSVSIVTYLKP
jgi:hypothetical protein